MKSLIFTLMFIFPFFCMAKSNDWKTLSTTAVTLGSHQSEKIQLNQLKYKNTEVFTVSYLVQNKVIKHKYVPQETYNRMMSDLKKFLPNTKGDSLRAPACQETFGYTDYKKGELSQQTICVTKPINKSAANWVTKTKSMLFGNQYF